MHFFSFIWPTYFRKVGEKHRNIFVRFLVQMKTSKSHSEINWPLLCMMMNNMNANIIQVSIYLAYVCTYAGKKDVFTSRKENAIFAQIRQRLLKRRGKSHITYIQNTNAPLVKVIHPKYSKHWSYPLAHTIDCVCSKMLIYGLNHGLLYSLFKLIPCHLHWIIYVLNLNFIFEF